MTAPSCLTALGDGRRRATEHAGSTLGDDGLHFSPVAALLMP
ncbi:hypothetical protein [Agromyces sp. NPDC058064]